MTHPMGLNFRSPWTLALVFGAVAVQETVGTILRSFVDNLPTTIVSLATLVSAVAAYRRIGKAEAKVDQLHDKVEVVRQDVNSKTQQWIDATREAAANKAKEEVRAQSEPAVRAGALAEGELKGRTEERAGRRDATERVEDRAEDRADRAVARGPVPVEVPPVVPVVPGSPRAPASPAAPDQGRSDVDARAERVDDRRRTRSPRRRRSRSHDQS